MLSLWQKTKWWALGLIILAGGVLVTLAPEEKTLGAGIKPVYVHVSLTWAGMIVFFVATALALAGLLIAKPKVVAWLRTVYFTAIGLYLAGFLVSMLASYVNWGGVPFREPRVLSAINVLVVAGAAGVLMNFVPWLRLVSLLGGVPLGFIIFGVQSSRMVLHPDSPVSAAPTGIRNTFMGMFALALMLAVWLVVQFRPKAEEKE